MKDEIFERRRARAFAIMAEKKMWGSHAPPPLHRLLWNMNIPLPLPPFAAFWLNVLVFASLYTLMMPLLLLFPSLSVPTFDAISIATNLMAALFFGLSIAGFYAWRKKVYRLPEWDQL